MMYTFASSHHAPLIFRRLHPHYASPTGPTRGKSVGADSGSKARNTGSIEQPRRYGGPNPRLFRPADVTTEKASREDKNATISGHTVRIKVKREEQDVVLEHKLEVVTAKSSSPLSTQRCASERRSAGSDLSIKQEATSSTSLKRSCSSPGIGYRDRALKRHRTNLVGSVS